MRIEPNWAGTRTPTDQRLGVPIPSHTQDHRALDLHKQGSGAVTVPSLVVAWVPVRRASLPSSPVRTGPDGSGVGGYDTCRAPPGQQAPVFGTAAGQRVLLVARLRGGVNRSAITAIVDGMRR